MGWDCDLMDDWLRPLGVPKLNFGNFPCVTFNFILTFFYCLMKCLVILLHFTILTSVPQNFSRADFYQNFYDARVSFCYIVTIAKYNTYKIYKLDKKLCISIKMIKFHISYMGIKKKRKENWSIYSYLKETSSNY